ncbi:MAG: hypothetical protein IPP88_25120 [Betaproteobacteria bacterium]|nr:hypothetical protein [Betaproteobacteria bacterium]
MKQHRTAKVFAIIVGVYVAALLPGLVWPQYLDTPIGVLAVIPYLSVYMFHSLGIPGLLQNAGACGWGWCKPTWFGWCFIATVGLGLAWLVARGIASLTASEDKEP